MIHGLLLQVETFRQGGKITERRNEWAAALERTSVSDLSRRMLIFLGRSPEDLPGPAHAPSPSRTPTKSPSECGSSCGKLNNTGLLPEIDEAAFNRLCVSEPCDASNAGQLCQVCQEQMHLHGPVVKLPCSHPFHEKCIREWLRQSATCPVCRSDYTTIVGCPGHLRELLQGKAGLEVTQQEPALTAGANSDTALRRITSGQIRDEELSALLNVASEEGWFAEMALDDWERDPSVQESLFRTISNDALAMGMDSLEAAQLGGAGEAPEGSGAPTALP